MIPEHKKDNSDPHFSIPLDLRNLQVKKDKENFISASIAVFTR